MQRRELLISASLGAAWAASGCHPVATKGHISGGFTGINAERGHALRDGLRPGKAWPAPSKIVQTGVVIAGGGVAGLAAARALRLQGIEDFVLLELEDTPGGNSRAGVLGGMACPQGAHYLPVPGPGASEVQDLLEELGVRQRVSGRWQYDERSLCHSPQERLFFRGHWQEGLLPLQGVEAATLAQYRQFADLVEREQRTARWVIPMQNRALSPAQSELAAITFTAYLEENGLTDPHLRWYLDYCCRDDYGAGMNTVSAWAGLHYFASRHGFHVPGQDGTDPGEREGVLTWPEGNAWLTRQLAAPLGARVHTGSVVVRIANTRTGVEVDALDTRSQTLQRWVARRAVVALPLFVAARVVHNAPDFLRQAAQSTVYAPWLVANVQLSEPLADRPGAAPAWDNVLYGTSSLGYVDAMHQSLQTVPGPTVLTHYQALGLAPLTDPRANQRLLLERPWTTWRDEILIELSAAHPDIVAKTRHMELTRYGHAMAIPVPRVKGQIGPQSSWNVREKLSNKEQYPQRPVPTWQHLAFAHSDWAGYSVFEEAFALGHAAGRLKV
ncbi:MAG: FAD-dependent oxidoreductase [Candidatus Saccharibacteria bacterium]|nr:FAD-dependent oxidoreductase [Rhodoferax sp.]